MLTEPHGLEDASVLVTGATGFLGSHLVSRLAGRCARVVAMARGTASTVHPGLHGAELVLGDVTVASHMQRALDGVDVVFHFAGHSGALASAHDPMHDLQVNAGGIITLLETIRKKNRPCRVIFPGSRLEYGRVDHLPVCETTPLAPLSPYGAGKAACEAYLDMFSRLYGISYAVARLTNPYGRSAVPPAREYNVVNKMITTAEQGGEITVYGDGSQLRDYIHVDDTLDALLHLAVTPRNVVANVGTGTGISFRAAAETIVRVAGKGTVVTKPWPPEVQRLETGDFVADVSKMKALGWSPRVDFEQGVRRTAGALQRV